MPDVQNINLSKNIKRLELIKNLISLEEEDEIDGHRLFNQRGKLYFTRLIIHHYHIGGCRLSALKYLIL